MYVEHKYLVLEGESKIVRAILSTGVESTLSEDESKRYLREQQIRAMRNLGVFGTILEVHPELDYRENVPLSESLILEDKE